MNILHDAVCPFVIAIISILAGQAGAVEISVSMDPPILEVGKAVTLKWKIKYRVDAKYKASYLYLKKRTNDTFIEIASYDSDKTSHVGKNLLGEKADVTSITLNEVIVNVKKLEFLDEFYFMCKAHGVTASLSERRTNSNVSVVDVKGGPTICGSSIIKEEYVLPVGNSSLDVTLCGNPRPRLSHVFDGNTFEVLGIEVDNTTRMYKYKIQMMNIEPNNCGQNITFQASGFGDMFHKSSTIIVKHKPQMVKDFQYTKTIGENCTVFKVEDEHNPKCPLNYEVKIYDKNKIATGFENNSFTFPSNSKSLKVCCTDWFNKGKFATITPIWRHEPSGQELVGPVSDFIKVQTKKVFNNYPPGGKKKTSTSQTLVIPLALGIVIIFIIIVILRIYKNRQKDKVKVSQSDNMELMKPDPGPEEHVKGVPSSTTNPGQYPLYEPRQPEYFELENSKPVPLYSELGEGGGRAGSKPVMKPESNYADAKDVDYPDNKHNVYPDKYERKKDVFDPVDSSDCDEDNCVSLGKVFKSPFGDECGNVSRPICPLVNQDQKISTTGVYPNGYNTNKGLPMYLDPNASITNNPPKLAFYERETAPGMPKLPPVAYPKFDRSKIV